MSRFRQSLCPPMSTAAAGILRLLPPLPTSAPSLRPRRADDAVWPLLKRVAKGVPTDTTTKVDPLFEPTECRACLASAC